jgi:hypothetical protein
LGYLPKEEEIVEETTPKTEEAQDQEGESGPSQATAGGLARRPLWRNVLDALLGAPRKLQTTLCGWFLRILRWILQWFVPRVLVGVVSLWGFWMLFQIPQIVGDWVHPLERVNAFFWCINPNTAISIGQPYPLTQAPSVQIAPWLWCNPRSPTGGVAGKMRILFPHLG